MSNVRIQVNVHYAEGAADVLKGGAAIGGLRNFGILRLGDSVSQVNVFLHRFEEIDQLIAVATELRERLVDANPEGKA